MPACQPVGKRLLELFGWKEGQGIGPKRVSQRLSSQVRLPPSSLQQSSSVLPHGPSFLFAPKNTAVFDPGTGKSNFWGLGFDPYTNAPEFRRPRGAATDASCNSRGAFGIGTLEEDDDLAVYDRADRSQCVRYNSLWLLSWAGNLFGAVPGIIFT